MSKTGKGEVCAFPSEIIDYMLFPEALEFYATYRLMNGKSHKIYSDKLRISVLDLKHIELATEEGRAYRLER